LNLGEDGFSTLSPGTRSLGSKLCARTTVDLVVTDLKLPGIEWPGVFAKIKRQNASASSGGNDGLWAAVETAVEAMKVGQ